ncbi:MAG: isochorismatase family protein [Candidatus Schekmanbacteria bacterium]|nr:isochorismatase family protein [Candidatus Schekmanbacteria bacterium]
MELLDRERSIVVVIDLQGKLVDMVHDSQRVISGAIRLMRIADLLHVPVLLTEQYPRGLGPTAPDVRAAFDGLATNKGILEKTSFGCCGDTGFEASVSRLLPNVVAERRQIVVAGIEAHVCVMQTVLELLRAGSAVHVAWDAVSGRGERQVDWALVRMQQAGAIVTSSESVGFEWLRDKQHSAFKGLSNLLKEHVPA